MSAVPLPIVGEVPPWLDGVLLRNGPALWEGPGWRVRHWFDGLAMLHAFHFRDGEISYTNRFLRSPQYQHVGEHGRLGFGEFATNPRRSPLRRLAELLSRRDPFGHNASVNVHRLAGRHVALTETPLPVEFDPRTLRTLGPVRFEDGVEGMGASAHPHTDPTTGDTISTMTRFARESSYKIFRVSRDEPRREVVAELPAHGGEPAYMHSFGVTERHVILAEYPLVAEPLKILLQGKPYAESLTWKPERPTRFVVLNKRNGATVGIFEAEPFFCFHHVNAFERDDELLVDLLAFPDDSVIRKLYLDALRGPEEVGRDALGELRRYRIPLGEQGGTVIYEKLSDEVVEFPRIDYSRNGREYRYVYGVGVDGEHPAGWADLLPKLDIARRGSQPRTWHEEGCYPGEPVFVPAPGAQEEDEGVILSVVLDTNADGSFLLILNAASMRELARAYAPHRIPFGFHGQYFG